MTRFALCLTCLFAAACAGAGRDAGPRGGGDGARAGGMTLNPAGLMIAGCDADGDYRVSADELEAGIARGFAAADADRDGAVDLIELSDWRARAFGDAQALPGPFAFDRDQDGRIGPDEFAAAIRAAAAPYARADGSIPFAALTRQTDRFARAGEGGRIAREDRGLPDGRRGPGGGGEPPF